MSSALAVRSSIPSEEIDESNPPVGLSKILINCSPTAIELLLGPSTVSLLLAAARPTVTDKSVGSKGSSLGDAGNGTPE